MGERLLTIENLHIEGRSDDRWMPITHGINLNLNKGEVLGLIGESGAGKSTIGLAAMGYTHDGCRIAQGSVNFNGINLLDLGDKERRAIRGNRIAYVAQSAAASFNPAHKLIEQYAEGPVVHEVMSLSAAEAEGMELFEKLRLPNPHTIGLRYPHQVSGGQLQRAMTAMAMSCHPDLIIFDEPTTALDVTTQIEVLSAIRDIVNEYNTAAIYITHDLAVVAQMADRVKVLLKGHEVEEAETRAMLSAPKEDYTKSLWAVRNFAAAKKPPADADAVPVIEVRNLSAGYNKEMVLHDLNFKIQSGRTVAVVGESGSGKSTAARTICGLLPQANGQVLLNGQELPPGFRARSKEQLRQTQIIYQMADTALNPKQKIGDIIARPLQFYSGLSGPPLKEQVRALLNQIELEPDRYINRLPGELSGGQKQRIGIARALAASSQFIVCDEVTSALDQLVAEGILRLLEKLQQEHNLAYMFITHDLATVRAIADEVIVMQHGVIVESGEKESLFSPPHHAYTELLLSSVPEMDPDWLDNLLEKRHKARL
jgi:peptide/nickel transport system ATP-binding protein